MAAQKSPSVLRLIDGVARPNEAIRPRIELDRFTRRDWQGAYAGHATCLELLNPWPPEPLLRWQDVAQQPDYYSVVAAFSHQAAWSLYVDHLTDDVAIASRADPKGGQKQQCPSCERYVVGPLLYDCGQRASMHHQVAWLRLAACSRRLYDFATAWPDRKSTMRARV